MERKRRKLVLNNGQIYEGYSFGSTEEVACELVFNTSMVGYQEIFSDPSCADQGVVMTYPVIGNYGTNDDDYETKEPSVKALIVREYNDNPSNFRYTKSLGEIMEEDGIVGIYGLDTRKLTRVLREGGLVIGVITDMDTPDDEAIAKAKSYEIPTDAVQRVSCRKKWYKRTTHSKLDVVAIDCGIEQSSINSLNRRGCTVTVVPYNTTAEQILALNPDGIFLSNGPGSADFIPETVETVKALKGSRPIFAIGLGNLVVAKAYGATVYEMKCGHRGGNQPVRNLETGKIEIVSQNHGYAVDKASVENTELTVTHENVLDKTVEGVACEKDGVFAVQFHPESAPGHKDNAYLIDKFVKAMEDYRNAKKN